MSFIKHAFMAMSFVLLGAMALFTSGCSASLDTDRLDARRPEAVPSEAHRVAMGEHVLTYTAEHTGTAYVADRATQRLVVATDVRPGDRIRVDPTDDSVLVNGRRVSDQNLESTHDHAIYFVRRDDAAGARLSAEREMPAALRDGRLVAWGRGEIGYRAEDDGRLYVWDKSSREIVYETDVRRGDRIVVSPDRDFISMDVAGSRSDPGRYRLYRDHDYELYFSSR